MKKKIIAIISVATACIMTFAGCSNNSSSSDVSQSSTSSGTTSAVQYDDSADMVSAIKAARLGDTISFKDYVVFTQSDGTKVYFADGKYVFVVNETVIETREAISVAKSNSTIEDVLSCDKDFEDKDVDYYFYNSDKSSVSYDASSPLTTEIPYAVAEFVDWYDDDKTTGTLYSYAFTYGDAPVKVVSVYQASSEEDTSSGSSESSDDTSGDSSEDESSSAETDSGTSSDESSSAETDSSTSSDE